MAGILDRLLGPSRDSLAVLRTGTKISQTPGVMFSGPNSSAGVRVEPENSMSLSAVFAAVWMLSSVIGSLPLNVYRRRGDGGKDYADTNPAHYLLHTRPNDEMTASTFRRALHFHRLLWGNAYAEIRWTGAGSAYALWPVEPWRVQPKRDDNEQLYYEIDNQRRVSPRDMIHVPLISLDGVTGRSFIDYAFESLGLGLAAQEFAARFFGNGARPGGILKHPGKVTAKDRAELKEAWMKEHGKVENANKVAVIWGGWEYTSDGGSIPPQTAQLLETRRFTTEEVSRWLNIPPHLLRDLSRATFSNIESQGIDFVVYSLGPVLVDYEQEYDSKLLQPPKVFCKHNVGALMRGDSAARAAFYTQLFHMGVFSINDMLELEDMNPIGAAGDLRFVPLNMQTTEQALRASKAPPPPIVPDGNIQPSNPKQPGGKPQPGTPGVLSPEQAAVVADAMSRMLANECNGVRRASAYPSRFLATVDEFYLKHRAVMEIALTPILTASGVDASIIKSAVANHIETSKALLLEAAGNATVSTLAEVVSETIQQWPSSRIAAFVEPFTGAIHAETGS